MALHLVGGPNADQGEIAITGPQLADGYWNAPELTARQFRDLATSDGLVRAYYTGDWATRIQGNLYFTERIDAQVKIRGERVELGDISASLMKCGFGFACALLIDDVLHGVFEYDGVLPQETELRSKVGVLLPPHLVPRHFHAFAELPRNANGKVDAKSLRSLIDGIARAG